MNTSTGNITVVNNNNNDHRGLVFGLFVSISSLGVISHILSIIVISMVIRSKGASPFYVLSLNLHLSNLGMSALYLFYACPCILHNSQLYGDIGRMVFGGFQSVDFVSEVCATFLISVNRTLSVKAHRFNHSLFRLEVCYVYCFLCWLMGVGSVLANYGVSCLTVFNEAKYFFSTVCTKAQLSTLTSFSSIIVYICVYGVALFYVLAATAMTRRLADVMSTNVQENIRRYRYRLLCQAFCIWVALLMNVISFRVVPLFLEGVASAVVTGVIVLGHVLVAPICSIVLSQDIRAASQRLLRGTVHTVATGVSSVKSVWQADN